MAANVLLGVSQGLTWSTTVIMKIDLVGPKQRGLAMGLNEFAGYAAVAASALATGWIASRHGLRPQPFYLGIAYVLAGLLLSLLAVRETRYYVAHESSGLAASAGAAELGQREIFWRTTLTDRDLSSASQAGLVNNLNDGMAWGCSLWCLLLLGWALFKSACWLRFTLLCGDAPKSSQGTCQTVLGENG